MKDRHKEKKAWKRRTRQKKRPALFSTFPFILWYNFLPNWPRRANLEKKDKTENLKQNLPKDHNDTSVSTSAKIATELKVSEPTIKRDRQYAQGKGKSGGKNWFNICQKSDKCWHKERKDDKAALHSKFFIEFSTRGIFYIFNDFRYCELCNVHQLSDFFLSVLCFQIQVNDFLVAFFFFDAFLFV